MKRFGKRPLTAHRLLKRSSGKASFPESRWTKARKRWRVFPEIKSRKVLMGWASDWASMPSSARDLRNGEHRCKYSEPHLHRSMHRCVSFDLRKFPSRSVKPGDNTHSTGASCLLILAKPRRALQRRTTSRCRTPHGFRQWNENHHENGESHIAQREAAACDWREVVQWRRAAPCDQRNDESPEHQAGPDEGREQYKRPHGDAANQIADAMPKHHACDVTAVELADGQEIQRRDKQTRPASERQWTQSKHRNLSPNPFRARASNQQEQQGRANGCSRGHEFGNVGRHWHDLRCLQSEEQRRHRDDKSRQRSSHRHVGQ